MNLLNQLDKDVLALSDIALPLPLDQSDDTNGQIDHHLVQGIQAHSRHHASNKGPAAKNPRRRTGAFSHGFHFRPHR